MFDEAPGKLILVIRLKISFHARRQRQHLAEA
jgi:hypothetical protein